MILPVILRGIPVVIPVATIVPIPRILVIQSGSDVSNVIPDITSAHQLSAKVVS